MGKNDVDKSIFDTHHGLQRYIRMLFELESSPTTFQRTKDIILASVKWQCTIVYIDDVIAFFILPEEHVTHIEIILRLLKALKRH